MQKFNQELFVQLLSGEFAEKLVERVAIAHRRLCTLFGRCDRTRSSPTQQLAVREASARAVAKPPLNASPAATVSIACTGKAGIRTFRFLLHTKHPVRPV
jgi:hypothetical protein